MMSEPATRFGTVAFAGKPNAGKSTLLNALVGEKLAIVSPKPQSTRTPVLGLITQERCQLLLVDPPGLLEPAGMLQESMMDSAVGALGEADVILYLHPVVDGPAPPLESLAPVSRSRSQPVATVLTKADLLPEDARPVCTSPTFLVSATTGKGLPAVLEWCRSQSPPGEFRYDPDDIGTQHLRFFVAELVRESAYEILDQELPYSVAVLVDEFREGQKPVYIRVVLYVERESQKGMVIGKHGATIKAIGAASRRKVEGLIGERVFLDLWVKVLAKWRKSPEKLRMFGMPVTANTEKRN